MGQRRSIVLMMKLLRQFRNRDDGVTAIMVAISMLLIMGMASIVIDIGFGFNERRQDQTAADVSVMAGSLEFGTDLDTVIDRVIQVAGQNLDDPPTRAEWDACVNPDMDTFLSATGSALDFTALTDSVTGETFDCIAVANGTYLQVLIPEREVPQFFSRAIGASPFSVDALAISKVAPKGAGIRPFGLTNTAGPGQNCLRTGPAGTASPPCDGPEEGNFFIVDSPHLGNPDLGTTEVCTGMPQQRYTANLALGIDHAVTEFDGSERRDQCGTPVPNALNIQPGNGIDAAAGLYEDIASIGDNNANALLQQGPAPKRTIEIPGPDVDLDNQPIWDYLVGGVGPCDPTSFVPTVLEEDKIANMDACLKTGIPYFSDAVFDSPRLVWVPQFNVADWGTGSGWRQIQTFEPAFLHALYWNCDGISCDDVFYPGEASTTFTFGPGAVNLHQISSFVLSRAMLNPDLIPAEGAFGGLNVSTVELYR